MFYCFQLPAHRRFLKASERLELVQRAKLQGYLQASRHTHYGRAKQFDPTWGYERFSSEHPITDYTYWEPHILHQRKSREPVLTVGDTPFEPTSGSTSPRKWIPFPPAFTQELSLAASTWLVDLTRRYPRLSGGRQYWSLSWLPTELRQLGGSTDDTRVLPFWKRLMLSTILAVPGAVGTLPSSEASRLATMTYLVACRDLRLLSVWSPTFLTQLIDDISRYRKQIGYTLRKGCWPGTPNMGGISPPYSPSAATLLDNWDTAVSPEFLAKLWPELTLISAWDSSTSATWAHEVRGLFPHASFQGKGLWATEGAITIPFEERYPLAFMSHFFEFRLLESEEIVPSWQLQIGQRVQPILTTGSGLWRYQLQDQLEVSGFMNEVPCLRFIGRIGGCDFVGEKLDTQIVTTVLNQLSVNFQIRCITLVACRGAERQRPRYVVLAEGNEQLQAKVASTLESKLLELHHYQVAREQHQLDPAGAMVRKDALQIYSRLASVAIDGNRKIEAILQIKENLLRDEAVINT
ncbi:MAG: GH3 auxin-responsive promoter family protein [Nitrospirae bacterium]|nr:GH3 auxin-responsive promoter family protein [Nitrospirota bacterium]